jgi:phospholipid/cholesterol/gamma-HCH transport system permease protein
MTSQLEELGHTIRFVGVILRTFFNTRGNGRMILEQTAFVSYRSLSTIAASGLFVGAILVLQFNLILSRYDAQSLLGGLNTSAIIREIGPLLISFLLAGKVGAFTAAELGTMRVTEQIDAIECLGTDPVQFLIVPRFIAILISSMILLSIGLLVSIAGSMLLSSLLYHINFLTYAETIPRFTGLWTLFCGFFKSMIYAVIVAGVSCTQGFHATGGARGVGRAVTKAAIYTNFYIVIANFVSSHFLDLMYQFLESFR